MRKITRRRFLSRTGAVASAAFVAPTVTTRRVLGANERLVMGVIGCGGQGTGDMNALKSTGQVEYAAVCDVYAAHRERNKRMNGDACDAYLDFRDLLDRRDIDAVNIGTPDHWHALTAIAACQAGKDVYCQKPLSLTIEEGRAMVRAARRYGRVFQTGSQQRSNSRFRVACEAVRNGRIGKLKRIRTSVGANPTCGWEPDSDPPAGLDWNMYLGPARWVPFNQRRFIWNFRWFYDYSGGNLTDWGAHHLDIAQWAIDSLPVEIAGKATFPQVKNGYNVATDFNATFRYANGVVMTVSDSGRNGILFSGDRGRIFVNRGTLEGKPVEDLSSNPLPREDWMVYDFDSLDRPIRAGKLDAIIII